MTDSAIELDVAIGDSDGEIGENIAPSQAVNGLKLTCERYSSTEPLIVLHTERTKEFLPYSVGERDIWNLFRASKNGSDIQIRESYWEMAAKVLGGAYGWFYGNEDQYIDGAVSAIFFPLIKGKSKSHEVFLQTMLCQGWCCWNLCLFSPFHQRDFTMLMPCHHKILSCSPIVDISCTKE